MTYKSVFDPAIIEGADSVVILHENSGARVEILTDGHDFVYDFYMDGDLDRRVDVTVNQVLLRVGYPLGDDVITFYVMANNRKWDLEEKKRTEKLKEKHAVVVQLFGNNL